MNTLKNIIAGCFLVFLFTAQTWAEDDWISLSEHYDVVQAAQNDVRIICLHQTTYKLNTSVHFRIVIKNEGGQSIYVARSQPFYDFELDIKNPAGKDFQYGVDVLNGGSQADVTQQELAHDQMDKFDIDLTKMDSFTSDTSDIHPKFDTPGTWTCKIAKKIYKTYPDDFVMVSAPEFSFAIVDPNAPKPSPLAKMIIMTIIFTICGALGTYIRYRLKEWQHKTIYHK